MKDTQEKIVIDEKAFRKVVEETRRLLKPNQIDEFLRRAKISRPTFDRWCEGKSCPAPEGRLSVLDILSGLVRELYEGKVKL